MINKKLLRQIKQEGIGIVDYVNEIVENALLDDYNVSNKIPLSLWSYNELKTRYEELIHISWKLYALYPDYYKYVWYYGGEQWDIIDEMEDIAQMYGIDIYGE